MNRIEVEGLTKILGTSTILEDVTLEFESGKIYGLMGRNGSGKTVFLKCLCGFMKADSGVIRLNDKILKKDMEYLENTGFLIEHPGFIESATAFENLKYIASIKRLIKKNDIMKTIERVNLDPYSKKKIGKYSLGMKQRLGLAQAIMENPDILILDEPMNGLDESGVELIRKILLELKEQGKLIIIASHYQEDIHYLCDSTFYCKDRKLTKI